MESKTDAIARVTIEMNMNTLYYYLSENLYQLDTYSQ